MYHSKQSGWCCNQVNWSYWPLQSLSNGKALDSTKAINEYMDRQRQKCNLIVKNIPESPKQVKSKQIEEDAAKLSDLFYKEMALLELKLRE